MIVTTCARHHLHQLNGRIEKILKLLCRLLDNNPADEMRLLRRDTDRTIIGVAGPHRNASDSLHRRVGERDRVGAKRQCLYEIGWLSQAAGDDKAHIVFRRFIQMASCPRERRYCGNRYVIAEYDGGGAGASAPPVQNNIVDAHFERGIDIFFNMLRRKFVADRNTTRALSHFIGKFAYLAWFGPIGKARGGNGRPPSFKPRTSTILPLTFGPGRCPPVPVFAP